MIETAINIVCMFFVSGAIFWGGYERGRRVEAEEWEKKYIELQDRVDAFLERQQEGPP